MMPQTKMYAAVTQNGSFIGYWYLHIFHIDITFSFIF